MLKSLTIKNYALIDSIKIDFDHGFTAVTGETGAGKSILLGAISLLLGKRADLNVLFDKKKKCISEGLFAVADLDLKWLFKENDIDFEDETIIRREILPSGRSRAFINDTPVNLEILKKLGERLINIHSQNDTLQMKSSFFQLQVLDSFIDKQSLINDYRKAFTELKQLESVIERLTSEFDNARKDQDYLQFQLNEIRSLNLEKNEDERLKEREKLLLNAENIKLEIQTINELLSGSENNILEKLGQIKQSFSKLYDYNQNLKELAVRSASLFIELEDIANEAGKLNFEEDLDPLELSQINERLNSIYKLQQKHQVSSVDELLMLQTEIAQKLGVIDQSDEHIENLQQELEKTKTLALKAAEHLHLLREKEAKNLEDKVKNIIVQLGMKNAGFKIDVKKLSVLNSNGCDQVRFLFNANGVDELNEISKVASGGELSRLMLAIKSLVHRQKFLPTVIFDEIDAGVSGEIAGKVGTILRSMSKSHQLIAITHLPQIAAKSNAHFKVYKQQVNDALKTQIALLNEDKRLIEIAALLSDQKITSAAKEAAKELIRNSD